MLDVKRVVKIPHPLRCLCPPSSAPFQPPTPHLPPGRIKDFRVAKREEPGDTQHGFLLQNYKLSMVFVEGLFGTLILMYIPVFNAFSYYDSYIMPGNEPRYLHNQFWCVPFSQCERIQSTGFLFHWSMPAENDWAAHPWVKQWWRSQLSRKMLVPSDHQGNDIYVQTAIFVMTDCHNVHQWIWAWWHTSIIGSHGWRASVSWQSNQFHAGA